MRKERCWYIGIRGMIANNSTEHIEGKNKRRREGKEIILARAVCKIITKQHNIKGIHVMFPFLSSIVIRKSIIIK